MSSDYQNDRNRIDNDEDDLVPRLMNKISSQAMELSRLNTKLEQQSTISNTDFNSIRNEALTRNLEKSYQSNVYATFTKSTTSTNEAEYDPYSNDFSGSMMKNSQSSTLMSEVASKKRLERDYNLQIDILQRQLQTVESKLLEQNKSKKKLVHDLDSKTRELKMYEKLLSDKDNEINNLKRQLESTLKISSSFSSSHLINQTKSKNKMMIQNNLSNIVDKLKNDIEIYKENEVLLNSKLKVLEDALDFRSDEIGLSGKSDLLSKMAKLKGEILALKTELMDKTRRLVEVEEKKTDLNINNENLQKQITSMQQRLAQTEVDSFKHANKDMKDLLKSTEEERDKLLKYVQNDLQKNISMSKHIEQLESEISHLKNKELSLLDIIHNFEVSSKDNIILKSNFDNEVNKNKELFASIGRWLT